MPLRFPQRSFFGARAINPNSLASLTAEDDLPRDPASVRFPSIAEILLQGIRRCVVADRELDGDSEQFSNIEKSVLDNLGDSLPEPLDFVFDKPLSVSGQAGGLKLEVGGGRKYSASRSKRFIR